MAGHETVGIRPIPGSNLSLPPLQPDPGPAPNANEEIPLLDTRHCEGIENSWLRYLCKANAIVGIPLRLAGRVGEAVVGTTVDAANQSRAEDGLPPITASDLAFDDVVRAGFQGIENLSDTAVDKVRGLFEGLLPDVGFFGLAIAAIFAFFFLVR